MDLNLLRPGQSPADDAIATWSCEGVTLQLVPAGAGTAGRSFAVRELRPLGDGSPATHLQIVLFEGPRDAAQQHAEDLADARIWPAVRDVPGLAGAIVAVAADGARTVAIFASDPAAYAESVTRIFATELLPGEDPALLTGPTTVDEHLIGHATHQLRDLPVVANA